MTALLAGLLAGWAVAVPLGPVGAYLVALSVSRPWRTGAAAALGVATTDGLYALVVAAGGGALADRAARVQGPVRVVAGTVLAVLAVQVGWRALQLGRSQAGALGTPGTAGTAGAGEPGAGAGGAGPRPALRAYLLLVGLTAVNPTTVVAFAALVASSPAVGSSASTVALFAVGATTASAAWQLLLVTGAGLLGRRLVGRRGRTWTALTSSALLLALSVRTLV